MNTIEWEQLDDSWGSAQDQSSCVNVCLSCIMPHDRAFGIPPVQAVCKGGCATDVFLQAHPAIP